MVKGRLPGQTGAIFHFCLLRRISGEGEGLNPPDDLPLHHDLPLHVHHIFLPRSHGHMCPTSFAQSMSFARAVDNKDA